MHLPRRSPEARRVEDDARPPDPGGLKGGGVPLQDSVHDAGDHLGGAPVRCGGVAELAEGAEEPESSANWGVRPSAGLGSCRACPRTGLPPASGRRQRGLVLFPGRYLHPKPAPQELNDHLAAGVGVQGTKLVPRGPSDHLAHDAQRRDGVLEGLKWHFLGLRQTQEAQESGPSDGGHTCRQKIEQALINPRTHRAAAALAQNLEGVCHVLFESPVPRRAARDKALSALLH